MKLKSAFVKGKQLSDTFDIQISVKQGHTSLLLLFFQLCLEYVIKRRPGWIETEEDIPASGL